MPVHSGSCHCGQIKFLIDAEITQLTTCDCSLCKKKNALMTKVHENQFQLLSGADTIAEYRWNTKVARHFFCADCGIYTFHKKRSEPDHYGINIHCLDGFDASAVPVRKTTGRTMTVVGDEPREEWEGARK